MKKKKSSEWSEEMIEGNKDLALRVVTATPTNTPVKKTKRGRPVKKVIVDEVEERENL